MTSRSAQRGLIVLGLLLGFGVTGCGVQDVAAPSPAAPLMIGSEAPTPEPIIVGSEAPGLPLASSPRPSLVPVEESLAAGAAVEESRAEVSTVLAQLETIPVKGRAPQTGYDRDLFGSGWQDPDGNGCDARNDILGRDLTETIAKPGTHGCVITSGVLQDPFTAETIDFVRGQDTSTLVQIDHVVALSDAWQKGAQLMDPHERAEFANDPLNLLAVDGPTNSAKGDSDAATWLPPNGDFRCDYVARQAAVKAKHDLWMTQAEHDAIRRIVTTQCPAKKVATE